MSDITMKFGKFRESDVEQKKFIAAIQRYSERLDDLGVRDKFGGFTLKDSEGSVMPFSFENMQKGEFSIEFPKSKQFLEFVSTIGRHHDLKTPSFDYGKTEEAVNNIKVAIEPKDSKKNEVDSFFENLPKDADTIMEHIEASRQVAEELHERQEALISKKAELIRQYQSTGDEAIFSQMIALNDELEECRSMQANLSEVYEGLKEIGLELGSEELNNQIDIAQPAIELNTLHLQDEKKVMINTDVLRKEYAEEHANTVSHIPEEEVQNRQVDDKRPKLDNSSQDFSF